MRLRPQDWQRIMDIFDRAVELPPAERSALLHIECGRGRRSSRICPAIAGSG